MKSLELQFGNPELSGPKIIDDLKGLSPATTIEAESALILKIKEHYSSLTEIKQQHLLGRNELFNLCHLFGKEEGKALLRALMNIKGDESAKLEKARGVFLMKLDEMYTENTVWSRTHLEKEKEKRESPKGHRDEHRERGRHTNARRSSAEPEKNRVCKICGGNHHNGYCDRVAQMDLKQVEELELCPHCLEDRHEEECPRIKWSFVCKICNISKKLKELHKSCQDDWNKAPEQNQNQPDPPPLQ